MWLCFFLWSDGFVKFVLDYLGIYVMVCEERGYFIRGLKRLEFD